MNKHHVNDDPSYAMLGTYAQAYGDGFGDGCGDGDGYGAEEYDGSCESHNYMNEYGGGYGYGRHTGRHLLLCPEPRRICTGTVILLISDSPLCVAGQQLLFQHEENSNE